MQKNTFIIKQKKQQKKHIEKNNKPIYNKKLNNNDN